MSDHATHLPPSLADDIRRRMALVEMRSPATAMPWAHPPALSPQPTERPQVQAQADAASAGSGSKASALASLARQVAERVYEMMRYDLRVERERLRGAS